MEKEDKIAIVMTDLMEAWSSGKPYIADDMDTYFEIVVAIRHHTLGNQFKRQRSSRDFYNGRQIMSDIYVHPNGSTNEAGYYL